MLFNSYQFIFLFLPVVFIGTFWLGRFSHRLASLWLGLASLVFYSVWDVRFLTLLLLSISVNYGAGYCIGLYRNTGALLQAKYFLVAAITVNLLVLAYFKYVNFLIASLDNFLGVRVRALDVILPLGISFFTFTQIAFLVDVYRGIARERDFLHYHFPHLIAGPLFHHRQMMPQFANPVTWRIDPTNVTVGLMIFVLGLSKKKSFWRTTCLDSRRRYSRQLIRARY